eukprot:6197856-Pleurochrysis_carterae.AAC.3
MLQPSQHCRPAYAKWFKPRMYAPGALEFPFYTRKHSIPREVRAIESAESGRHVQAFRRRQSRTPSPRATPGEVSLWDARISGYKPICALDSVAHAHICARLIVGRHQ